MMTSKYFRTFAFWTVSVLIWDVTLNHQMWSPSVRQELLRHACVPIQIFRGLKAVLRENGAHVVTATQYPGGRPAPVVPDAGGGEANGSCVVCTDAPPFYQTWWATFQWLMARDNVLQMARHVRPSRHAARA